MKIQGLPESIYFRANVLAEKYQIQIDEARELKAGNVIDVSSDKANRLIGDKLAYAIAEQPKKKIKKGEK